MSFASVYRSRRLIYAPVCETAVPFLALQDNPSVIDIPRNKLLVLVYLNVWFHMAWWEVTWNSV